MAAVRLVLSIITTLMWEAALVAVWRWGLPMLGIRLPAAFLLAAMVALAAYAVISYRIGTRALQRKILGGMSDMIGIRGRVVIPLAPKGMIFIHGELWTAKSSESSIRIGEHIEVVAQDGLKLLVVRAGRRGG